MFAFACFTCILWLWGCVSAAVWRFGIFWFTQGGGLFGICVGVLGAWLVWLYGLYAGFGAWFVCQLINLLTEVKLFVFDVVVYYLDVVQVYIGFVSLLFGL